MVSVAAEPSAPNRIGIAPVCSAGCCVGKFRVDAFDDLSTCRIRRVQPTVNVILLSALSPSNDRMDSAVGVVDSVAR